MARYLLFITVVVLAIGMGRPPAPVCKYDPVFNQEISNNIKYSCEFDCTNRQIQHVNCISDCITFMKWGYKYSEEK